MEKTTPITELNQVYAAADQFCLTKNGTLIGGLEMSGRDPDGLTDYDFQAMALLSRQLFQNLGDMVKSVTHYYIHIENEKVKLKERDYKVSNFLSKSREKYLNQKNLNESRIIHLYEVKPEENLTRLNGLSLLKHLVLSLTSVKSKEIIKKHFSDDEVILILEEDLKRQKRELSELLNTALNLWESLAISGSILSYKELWRYLRFFGNLDAEILTDTTENVPEEEWDFYLNEGDIYPVKVAGEDALKFVNVESTYAKIISVTKFGEKEIPAGVWAKSPKSPVRQKGNFILMNRFCPLSKLQQSLMFSSKEKELRQKNYNVYAILSGRDENGELSNDSMKPLIKKKLKELEDAEMLGDKWGNTDSAVLTFEKSPKKLFETTRRIKTAMQSAGMNVVIESIDLPDAYKTFLPGMSDSAIRRMRFNTTQFGAITHAYKTSQGQKIVRDLGGEESQYVFYSSDGSPFYFSPFVGGRCLIIGVGPIRSGKSFLKNVIASHFMKYGGYFSAIDIDPGFEPIARLYGENGGIFRIGENNRGFNPFAIANGPDDHAFINHMINIVKQMIRFNDATDMQHFSQYEQKKLDEGIVKTLKLPSNLRNFNTMIDSCASSDITTKLKRWVSGGMYSRLFGHETDAIGALAKKVAAYNLGTIKDDTVLLPLAMTEIFYRTTRLFENPEYRHLPKFLDVDEAHALLSISYCATYIVRSIRTWGKWLGGIGLWTQYAQEFRKIPDWGAIKSAASTMFFTADPTLDENLYKSTFDLTSGECEAIRNLRPKGEVYIIQKEIGVSKKLIVDVEPEQYVTVTSKPDETVLREQMIEKYGFQDGIQETIRLLNLNQAA